jgi:hypothetical protein
LPFWKRAQNHIFVLSCHYKSSQKCIGLLFGKRFRDFILFDKRIQNQSRSFAGFFKSPMDDKTQKQFFLDRFNAELRTRCTEVCTRVDHSGNHLPPWPHERGADIDIDVRMRLSGVKK